MTQDTPRLNCLCLHSWTISCYFSQSCSIAWQHTHLRNCLRKMFTLRLLFPSSRAICRQKNCGSLQLATATTRLISRNKQEFILTNKYPANTAQIWFGVQIIRHLMTLYPLQQLFFVKW